MSDGFDGVMQRLRAACYPCPRSECVKRVGLRWHNKHESSCASCRLDLIRLAEDAHERELEEARRDVAGDDSRVTEKRGGLRGECISDGF